MKKNFLILLLLINTFLVTAQNKLDVIYLNDGSIIRGVIKEKNEEVTKIETECGNLYVYQNTDIQRMDAIPFVAAGAIKEKGYFNYNSIGELVGSSMNEKPAVFSFLMEHNYRFGTYFSPGIVTGIELLNEATVCLGGNMKLLLPLDKGSTLFWGTSCAYSFSLEKPAFIDNYYKITQARGGTMVNTELGVILRSNENSSFFVALGYRYNELNYEREDWYMTRVERKLIFNRISLRLGLTLF